MAKIDGDDRELTAGDAAIVKGMLERGDKQHHIAAYFGVDSRAVSHIATGKAFVEVKLAGPTQLPPPGPYRIDPTYLDFYRAMARVNALWNQRKLKEAKVLLESRLKSPILVEDRNEVEETLDDLFRDELGILVDLN